jgi:dolichol-phosphate mannosyltransferase
MLRTQINKQFAIVGLLGMVIDLVLFQLLVAVGANAELSQVASFFSGAIFFFGLNARGTRAHLIQSCRTLRWRRYGRALTVSLLSLLLRSAILLLFIGNWHWQPQAAILVAILTGAAVLFIGTALFILPEDGPNEMPALDWRVFTVATLAYISVLRLAFMGLVNLIPEEAYYWNYAQHLDLSYLDHPPMVAWLIWLSTSVLGKSEFSVRLPAYISWIVAAVFMFRLTVNLCDRTSAFRGVLLLAVLPIYFGLGFFMTPDAPLFAAWAGSLYFLERALLSQNHKAWWGVGVCMGVGMLAKYTMALLGLSTLAFVLIDRQSRQWLVRPEPYLAAIIIVTFFTPVLVWNMSHDWVSFQFQGPDRWGRTPKFSLHVLIGSCFLLLTPTALFGIVKVLLPQTIARTTTFHQNSTESRRYLWVAIFTLVPLSVFVFYSLRHQTKLNWTAPIWLATIPLLAWDMVSRQGQIVGSLTKLTRRLWIPTIIALLFILGGSFHYILLGLPGAGPVSTKRLFGPWQLLGEKVGAIETLIETETNAEPIIVGMDRNFISSELSFYDLDNDATLNTGGLHFFGGRSLMWAFWLPATAALGKNFLMIDLDRQRLGDPSFSQYFDTTSDVSTEVLEKNGRKFGYFYWRVGYGYRGLPETQQQPSEKPGSE